MESQLRVFCSLVEYSTLEVSLWWMIGFCNSDNTWRARGEMVTSHIKILMWRNEENMSRNWLSIMLHCRKNETSNHEESATFGQQHVHTVFTST